MNRLANEIRIFNSLILKMMQKDQEERLATLLPGVTGLQFGVLRTLQVKEYTLADLSSLMMLSAPTLIPALDRLEHNGLIQRVQDGKDRRKNNLVLTAKGINILEQTIDFEEDDLMTRSVNSLGIQNSRELNRLLQEIVRLMSPEVDLVSEVQRNLNHQEQTKDK